MKITFIDEYTEEEMDIAGGMDGKFGEKSREIRVGI